MGRLAEGEGFEPLTQSVKKNLVAEGEGFEPPLPVKVKRFSRPPVSTAHTSLRVGELASSLLYDGHPAASQHRLQIRLNPSLESKAASCVEFVSVRLLS